MSTVERFLGLIRFSHTVFALPFALLSAVLAWRVTPFRSQDLLGIILCMVFARSSAMAFNRFIDRDIDAANPRTVGRHLPAGLLSTRAVIAFIALCSGAFILSTLMFLPNRWPLWLAGPVLAFLLGYSYAKRFTSFCHYWLSAALMLAPIAAWLAITGSIAWPPIVLAGVVFFWVGGFDIIYATQDAEFDREKGLFSLPSRLGVKASLRLAAVSHALAIACLVALWWVASLGPIFLIGVVAVAILLVYEHLLVRPDDLSRLNIAFFNVNAVISLGLLLVGLLDIWISRLWA
jgi:4-hydroxybenzoate polyprenyltransferase